MYSKNERPRIQGEPTGKACGNITSIQHDEMHLFSYFVACKCSVLCHRNPKGWYTAQSILMPLRELKRCQMPEKELYYFEDWRL